MNTQKPARSHRRHIRAPRERRGGNDIVAAMAGVAVVPLMVLGIWAFWPVKDPAPAQGAQASGARNAEQAPAKPVIPYPAPVPEPAPLRLIPENRLPSQTPPAPVAQPSLEAERSDIVDPSYLRPEEAHLAPTMVRADWRKALEAKRGRALADARALYTARPEVFAAWVPKGESEQNLDSTAREEMLLNGLAHSLFMRHANAETKKRQEDLDRQAR